MSPRRFFGWPGLSLVFVWWMAPSLSGATELDLEAVIELALERNPRYREVLEVRREVDAGVREARADAFPEVDLSSAWSRSRDPSFLTGADFEDILELFPGFEPGEQEIWSLAFEVRQALYSSGKVRAGIEAAKLVVDLSEARIEQARLDTALAASETFFEVWAARRALEEVQRQEAARRESLRVVDARYELGEATRLERLRAVASLAAVAPEIARYRGALTVARSRLRRMLSLPPGEPLEIVAPVAFDGPGELPEIPELVERAWQNRPELRDLRLQDRLLEQRQAVTRADGRPQLELTGRFGRRGREVGDLEDSLFDDWRVALGFSWSLFDAGRRREQVAQLESQKTQLAWQLEALENEITFEIASARSALETARLRLEAAGVAAEASREATRVARESYREGVALQADLLAAEEQEIDSELERIEAARLVSTETVRLRRATGQMPLEDSAPPAAEAESEGESEATLERGALLHEAPALRCPSSARRVAESLPRFPAEAPGVSRAPEPEPQLGSSSAHKPFCPFGSIQETR